MKKIIFSLLFLLGLSLFSTRSIMAYEVPNYDGLVNDFADVLSSAAEEQLETQLQATAEASDGAEIAVVTINNLDGDSVENVTQEFFDQWQLGKKHLDNGVILLVAINDKKLRIQTGYGAESVITDAEAGRIINNVITPEFKTGDYEAGIIQGVAAIEQQFSDSPGFAPGINPINQDPGLMQNFAETMMGMITFLVMGSGAIYMLSWLGRSKAWWPGGLGGLIFGAVVGGTLTAIFLGIFGLILDFVLSKNYQQLKKAKQSTGWKNTWGGFKFPTSSGGGFGSGGGFSSGGGSSGGGGASGGW